MPVEIVMPAMEMAQNTGKLVHWLKTEGEFVNKGEPLLLIETDKVTVEIEAPASGILSNLTAVDGDEVSVGHVIAQLLTMEESSCRVEASRQSPGAGPFKEHKQVAVTPVARRLAEERGLDLSQIPVRAGRIEKGDVLAYLESHQTSSAQSQSQSSTRLIPASPKARRLAAEQGLEWANLVGSGPQGAVLAADLKVALGKPVAVEPAVVSSLHGAGEYRVVPITGIRQTIAQRLLASYQNAPHIALTISVNMTEARRLIERLGPDPQSPTKGSLTTTAVLARIIGLILLKYPRLNAHLVEGEIREFTSVHLGIAVALDEGLIVPVIRSIEHKGLWSIQSELQELSERARTRALKPHEVRGSTFTVSNLGMFGIEQFTSILNPPEVGILSVGVIHDTPVAISGDITLQPMMQITLNADHRAVDGALAAAFLQALKQSLENPYLLLA